MTDADRGLDFKAEILTAEGYLNRWLTDSVKDTVRETTFERYEQITRKHIVPEIGRVKLKALTPAHVRGLYKAKLESELSPRTVQYVHVTLHKALKQAEQDGLVPRNAAKAVKPPQVRREDAPLDAGAGRGHVRCGAQRPFGSPLRLGRHHGPEIGRVVGARVGRREPGRRHAAGQARLPRPKAAPCSPPPRPRAAAGPLWRENGLIIASEAGEPLVRRYVTPPLFKPLLRRVGLPRVRLHGLRHACATLLSSKNVNLKGVSEMLGHASIAITLDTYSYVLPDMQDSAARAMEEALS